MRKALSIVVVVTVAILLRQHFKQQRDLEAARISDEQHQLDTEELLPERDEARSSRFDSSAVASDTGRSCDGRTRCPEMKSCEEARWFLANCSGMKMDGDKDGVPCEDQWCSRLR